jgi:hypothetical protein
LRIAALKRLPCATAREGDQSLIALLPHTLTRLVSPSNTIASRFASNQSSLFCVASFAINRAKRVCTMLDPVRCHKLISRLVATGLASA